MSKRRRPSPFENELLQDLVSYAQGRPDGTVDLNLSGITWDDDRAAYQVCWSDEDGLYVGTCAEFGGLSHLSQSPEQALTGIMQLVRDATDAGPRVGTNN